MFYKSNPCLPWRKLPQGGLTQARRKAKRQGDLITILTPDVPLLNGFSRVETG